MTVLVNTDNHIVSSEGLQGHIDEIVKEGEALAALNPKIVVKVPMIKDGIKAIKYFTGLPGNGIDLISPKRIQRSYSLF